MFEKIFGKKEEKGPETTSAPEQAAPVAPGSCPACTNAVSMKTDDGRELQQEVGFAVICNHCAAELEIVDTNPLTFEMLEEAK